MNTYVNISNELRSFFSTNKIFRSLLPLDIIIMFAGLALLFLNNVLGIYIGGVLVSLVKWVFILGLLLTYASFKEQFLYIGLLGYGGINLIELLIGMIGKYHVLYWSNLFAAAVYGGLGYLVLRKTMVAPSNTNINA